MALFSAAIRRDSVSPLRFPFLSHVHIFSSEMSLVSRLKHPLSCFSFHFLFSGHFCSFDPRVISIASGGCNQSSSTLFYVVFESQYRCVNAVFNAGKTSSSFFSCQSISYRGCKTLWIVFSFLVLWFICLSSSLIYFKNGPEYLLRETAQVFTPLVRFQQYSFVSRSFLFFLRYSF